MNIFIFILIQFSRLGIIHSGGLTAEESKDWEATPCPAAPERTFTLGPSGFLKDGLPFRFISGSVQYFRVHPDDWMDRLDKLKHAGCNAVETYIEWSLHEPEPGVYDFSGWRDVASFLRAAQEGGLLVILRPGPYIDAERDMGGLPYWLMREEPEMRVRSSDPRYVEYVDRWFEVLFARIKPFLYANGGPIIMVQVENEYGSYGCDFAYTSHLRDLSSSLLGGGALLFTTDGCRTSELKCGKIANVYATVDFGPGTSVSEGFGPQRLFEPEGPLVNSEYYPGWLDYWGVPHSTRDPQDVARSLDAILASNASVNIYVFSGGTSFGMTTGSDMDNSVFRPCPTSYDYDAPLSEAGDLTDKYFAIRNVTQKYVSLPPGPIPGSSPKGSYGAVALSFEGALLDLAPALDVVSGVWPLTFEALSVPNGIVVYSTRIPFKITSPSKLRVPQIHDRGYVFVGDRPCGVLSREQEVYEVPISGAEGDPLVIVVESQGRLAWGADLMDFKGITKNMSLGGPENLLSQWQMWSVPLFNSTKLRRAIKTRQEAKEEEITKEEGVTKEEVTKEEVTKQEVTKEEVTKEEITKEEVTKKGVPTGEGGMAFYGGGFDVPDGAGEPKDTFLRLDGWNKGYAWVNDFLLGRYWPHVGPQVTLYIPRGLLRRGRNSLLVLELEKAPCTGGASGCGVSLVDTPEIDGPTPR